MSKIDKRTKHIIGIVALNISLIGGLVTSFVLYIKNTQKRFVEQNISDITNLNTSSANIAHAYFLNSRKRVDDLTSYAVNKNLSRDAFLSYMVEANANQSETYELVDSSTMTGFVSVKNASGGFEEVNYKSSTYYVLQSIFTAASSISGSSLSQSGMCTSEFTDSFTALKNFAQYTYLKLDDGSGTYAFYTLMELQKSEDVLNIIQLKGSYEGLATVIINSEGKYIFASPAFKSADIFTYFYVYNGLTYDERLALASAFPSKDSGLYYYKDFHQQDSIFVYSKVPESDFYALTYLPLSSFHSEAGWSNLYYYLLVALFGLLIASDLTYLYILNKRLRMAAEKEKEASDAKTDFLARMSHDIRTPLNVIIGTTYLAESETEVSKMKHYLYDIDQSGQFLLSLINDILDLNKVEAGKMELHPEPYLYKEFAGELTSIIGPLCQAKGIKLEISNDNCTNKAVLIDKMRLKQIIFNILSNSVKFTPNNGHISLHTKPVAPDGLEPGKKITLEFEAKDDGCGMSEEFQKHMFESFSQEDANKHPNVQGTGLGLAIVKKLVDLMHGTIVCHSELGKGTTFFITIPTELALPPKAEDEKQISKAQLEGKRVLLCEDNEMNAEIAKQILESAKMEVEVASNGQIGVEMFEKAPENRYDAILMDFRMPVMDGLEASKTIRSLNRKDANTIPIIAMTANAYDEDIEAAKAAGMNAHLSKPIDAQVLFKTLAAQIGKKD